MNYETGNVWVRLTDYPDYAVSARGAVMRVQDSGRYRAGYILKNIVNRQGYSTVSLGQNKWFAVHRLVASAFVENPQNLPQVNHVDGRKGNNNWSNLRCVTSSENSLHAYATGLRGRGEDHPCAKLKLAEVRTIRKMYESGSTQTEIAKLFGVNRTTVSHICSHRTWEKSC
jgi:hypothetical protein